MNWGRYFVDAVFRGGDKHSNHGNSVEKMIVHMVKKIRKLLLPITMKGEPMSRQIER
jgi:hypothetical protein